MPSVRSTAISSMRACAVKMTLTRKATITSRPTAMNETSRMPLPPAATSGSSPAVAT